MYSNKIKMVLKREGRTIKDLAEELGKSPQTIYNTINMEGKTTPKTGKTISVSYRTVEEMLTALGYEIVFRKIGTDEIVD